MVLIKIKNLYALADFLIAHPIALDGSSLLGTAIEHTPSVLHFLGAIKQSVSTPDVLVCSFCLGFMSKYSHTPPSDSSRFLVAIIDGGGVVRPPQFSYFPDSNTYRWRNRHVPHLRARYQFWLLAVGFSFCSLEMIPTFAPHVHLYASFG